MKPHVEVCFNLPGIVPSAGAVPSADSPMASTHHCVPMQSEAPSTASGDTAARVSNLRSSLEQVHSRQARASGISRGSRRSVRGQGSHRESGTTRASRIGELDDDEGSDDCSMQCQAGATLKDEAIVAARKMSQLVLKSGVPAWEAPCTETVDGRKVLAVNSDKATSHMASAASTNSRSKVQKNFTGSTISSRLSERLSISSDSSRQSRIQPAVLCWDLCFTNATLERTYRQQLIYLLCSRSVNAFKCCALYSLYSILITIAIEESGTDFDSLQASSWSRGGVVLCTTSWVCTFLLSIFMMMACQSNVFIRRPLAEWLVAGTVALIAALRIFLGGRWRAPTVIGGHPRHGYEVFSEEAELLSNLVIIIVYFGMHTPMRGRVFLVCCCALPLLFLSISTALCVSQGGVPYENSSDGTYLFIIGRIRVLLALLCVVLVSCVIQRRHEERARRDFLDHLIVHQKTVDLEKLLTRKKEEQEVVQYDREALIGLEVTAAPVSMAPSRANSRDTSMGYNPVEAQKMLPPMQLMKLLEVKPHKDPVQEIRRGIDALRPVSPYLADILSTCQDTKWDIVQRCARMVRDPSYTLQSYHKDVVAAFPELEFYKFEPRNDEGPATSTSAHSMHSMSASCHSLLGEYNRTVGAFYAIFWLLRVDMDGKLGWCFGYDDELELRVPDASRAPQPCIDLTWHKMSGEQRRAHFYHHFPWHHFTEVFQMSGVLREDLSICEERFVALLALTAIHDLMKNMALLPTVAAGHIYEDFTENTIITDHDIALSYILNYFPDSLPSFAGLNAEQRKAVVFTQGKMGFNCGWLVQGEAPPAALFKTFRSLIRSGGAGQEDVSFYFVHWITDLAGAVPTPREGSVKYVQQLPDHVSADFLRSFSYVWLLATRSETEVAEDYLKAAWSWTFPEFPVPEEDHGVAVMRLTLQAQRYASEVLTSFYVLDDQDRAILTRELNRTGIQGQSYSTDVGGTAHQVPALLVYYGPAMLQNNIRTNAIECLHVLAEVYRAGRALWPFRESTTQKEGSNTMAFEDDTSQPIEHNWVTIRIEQLKDYRVQLEEMSRAETFVMVKVNDREAVVERVSLDVINEWRQDGAKEYFLLSI